MCSRHCMVVHSFLDGFLLGFTYTSTPIIISTLHDNEQSNFNLVYSQILVSALCFHLGRSFISLFGIFILNGNAFMSIIISSAMLLLFSILPSSSIFWIFLTRFIIGLLSGYFSFCYETTRCFIKSRTSWIISIGLGSSIPLFACSYGPLSSHYPLLIGGIVSVCIFIILFLLVGILQKFGIDLTDEAENSYNQFKRPIIEMTPLPTVIQSSTNSDIQVPDRYLRGCGNDAIEGLRRWNLTLLWRKEYEVDNILHEPQPHFTLIKECYPHYIHGRSKLGHPVYYERLGHIKIAQLQEAGLGVKELIRHYVFIAEYMWTIVEPDDEFGQTVSVLDVSGVSVGDLMGEALEFLKESTKIIQSHYVERCHKIYVINASYFFAMIWNLVQPLIHENTRRKISILSTDLSSLQELIDVSQLPEIYGGTSEPLGASFDEISLKSYVEALNRDPTLVTEGTTINPRSSQGSILSNNKRRGGYVTLVDDGDEESGNHTSQTVETPQEESNFILGIKNIFTSSLFSWTSKEKEAFLGEANDFVYNHETQKWELQNKTHSNEISTNTATATTTTTTTNPLRPDAGEEQLIQAIQAAHGYVSESDGEGNRNQQQSQNKKKKSSIRNSIKEFKRNIQLKKDETLKLLSMWTFFHWFWRASLSGLLEIIPLLLLLNHSLMGLEMAPMIVGLIFLFGIFLLFLIQLIHYSLYPHPSSGIFISLINISLSCQFLSISLLVTYQIISSLLQINLLINQTLLIGIFLIIIITYFYTLLLTNSLIEIIMISPRSHLHTSLTRSKSYFIHGIGTILILILIIILKDLLPSSLTALTPVTASSQATPLSWIFIIPFILTFLIHFTLVMMMRFLNLNKKDLILSEIIW